MSEQLMAGRRDASWYDKPNCYDPKKIHVATKAQTSACRGVPLQGLRPAARVPQQQRCRADGCRRAWPKEKP